MKIANKTKLPWMARVFGRYAESVESLPDGRFLVIVISNWRGKSYVVHEQTFPGVCQSSPLK